MKIWIDTATGTWGEVDGDAGRLLIVDTDAIDVNEAPAGMPALEQMSDSEVVEFGDRFGHLAQ